MSVWIESFEQSYEFEGAAAFKKAVKAAPVEMRAALMSQLLPSLIDHDRKRKRPTPTLHELRSRFPDLAGVLADAYPLLPANYRLPVELRGYRILRVVGEGGQAIVLRAQDDMHSAVAIKLSSSPEHNELLLRERELLGQCQHPGIPEVIASGVEEDQAFFVMPFLRGMTLADKYSTHRPAAGEAARIAAELCSVVEHLHARCILHRDIKPSNVWLEESGAVKLIDLGMAIDRSSWGTPRPAVEEFHGTPAFMSPEQAAAMGENDGESSDVFSLGAVLYWMGTGEAPHGSGSNESVLSRATEGRRERDLLREVSNWPKPLVKVCDKALAADAALRHASAEALRDALLVAAAAKPATRWSPAIALLVVTLCVAAIWIIFDRYGLGDWATFGVSPVATRSTDETTDSSSVESARDTDSANGNATAESQNQIFDAETTSGREDTPRTQGGDVSASESPLPDAQGKMLVPVVTGPYRPGQPPQVTLDEIERPLPAEVRPAVTDPLLDPKASQADKIEMARRWLNSLPANPPMGDFVGSYVKPTGFEPIRSVVKAIRIRPGVNRSENYYFRFDRATADVVATTWDPEVNDLRRSLQSQPPFRYDFAMHRALGPSLSKEAGYLLVPPGWAGLVIQAEFTDGRYSKEFQLTNLDFCLTNAIEPLPGQRSEIPKGLIYLYQDPDRPGRRSNLFSFVKNHQAASDELRAVMARTYAGFYADPPPGSHWTIVSVEPDNLVVPDSIGPGPLYVHFVSTDKKTLGRCAYTVTRQKLEELAMGVMIAYANKSP